ncbi:FAD-dependent oxidoreductase [Neptunicella sp.]|uniref:FAD-dependent oxidoreductase n=1 Tax=Neptunicella sp. TaxID=2125986 RepID=UPI003F68C612
MQQYDVIVVGGGMVGATAALGLVKAGLSVALIEQHIPDAYNPDQPPDLRVSAISLGSERLLQQLGAWDYIQNMRLCVYRRLAVWEKEQMRTDFCAADLGVEHLGHIVENRLVQLGLLQAFNAYSNGCLIAATRIASFDFSDRPVVHLADKTTLQADWIVGADGANSAVRKAAEIGVSGWQYQQHALGITIKTDAQQQDITWQQFTPNGPVAFLPLYNQFASLVWYHNAERIAQLKQLSHQQLKVEIQKAFPPELVDFAILQVGSFPLSRMSANRYSHRRVVLIGDAAHTINPLAGQGVNLGFKDIQCLLELVEQQGIPQHLDDIQQLFSRYQRIRRRDNLLMSGGMDVLYQTFSNDILPIKWLRNGVLGATNKITPVKNQLMKYALGISR